MPQFRLLEEGLPEEENWIHLKKLPKLLRWISIESQVKPPINQNLEPLRNWTSEKHWEHLKLPLRAIFAMRKLFIIKNNTLFSTLYHSDLLSGDDEERVGTLLTDFTSKPLSSLLSLKCIALLSDRLSVKTKIYRS